MGYLCAIVLGRLRRRPSLAPLLVAPVPTSRRLSFRPRRRRSIAGAGIFVRPTFIGQAVGLFIGADPGGAWRQIAGTGGRRLVVMFIWKTGSRRFAAFGPRVPRATVWGMRTQNREGEREKEKKR